MGDRARDRPFRENARLKVIGVAPAKVSGTSWERPKTSIAAPTVASLRSN